MVMLELTEAEARILVHAVSMLSMRILGEGHDYSLWLLGELHATPRDHVALQDKATALAWQVRSKGFIS